MDGESAISHIGKAEHLRGLVTDIRMGPGLNGWEVAHRAREKFPSLAVVYVTGDRITEWSAQGVLQSTVLQKRLPPRSWSLPSPISLSRTTPLQPRAARHRDR